MFSKWKIEGIEGFVIGEDNNLYKLPFKSNGKCYDLKQVKKQHPNRYWINGEWYSQRQLRPKLYLDPNPIELFKTNDLPF